jgi:hypothetical protein
MMKKHPRLITALGITAMLFVLAVPPALAGSAHSNPNAVQGNCGHGACITTGTETVTLTTYPLSTTVITTTARTCLPNGHTAPPCGRFKSATLPGGSGISVGSVFAVLGVLFLGYLGVQRRRTLKLEDED